MKTKSFLHIQKILFFSLLVTIACLLFAFSAAGEEYSITVTIEGGDHGTVTLTVNEETVTVESGKPYPINGTDSYQIKEKAEIGYQANWSKPSGGTPQLSNDAGVNEDLVYTVHFEACSYNIHYVNLTEYWFSSAYVSSFFYDQSLALNPLPQKYGNDLIGWNLHPGNPDAPSDSYEGANLTIPANTYACDIWLEPIWESIQYTVFSIDRAGSEYLGHRTFTSESGKTVSALRGDESAAEYPGYRFTGNTTSIKVAIKEGSASTPIETVMASTNQYNTVFCEYEPLSYFVSYDLNAGTDNVTFSSEKPTAHIFNQTTEIPNANRIGYRFLGWTVTLQDGTVLQATPVKNYAIPKKEARIAEGGNLTLTAHWEALTYVITYNFGCSEDEILNLTDFSDAVKQFRYDSELTVPNPKRVGYTFLGWKVGGTDYGTDWTTEKRQFTSDSTLTAKWQINSYNFVTTGFSNANVTVTNEDGTPFQGGKVEYKTTLSIQVTANEGYKIVSWMGKTISHVKEYSGTLTVGAQDATFSCVVLRSHATPSVTLSFAEETVCMAEGGNYLITCLGETQTLPENKNPTLTIAEHFWGKTLSIVRLGDGETFSDSEPYSLTLPSRAASPENSFSVETGAYGISVNRAEESAIPMEYAVSKSRTGENLIWQDSTDFSDLEYGTAYYVYTRIKATDTHPASLPAAPLRCTTRTPTLTDGEITLLFFTVIIVILAQIICLLFLANPKKKKATHRTNAFFLLTAQPTVWILSLPQTALLGVLLATAVTLQIAIVFKLLKK